MKNICILDFKDDRHIPYHLSIINCYPVNPEREFVFLKVSPLLKCCKRVNQTGCCPHISAFVSCLRLLL